MANINRTPSNEEQKFNQIENDSWSGIYLPAICAGVVMTIVLFMAVSCSKKSDTTTKISLPVAPAVQSPAPTTASAVIPEKPKKAVKKHRPTTATYVNSNYGLALTFPRKYSLQPGDKMNEAPLQTGFLKPGATEIASLDMPDGLYPDTDFSSALLNVSVYQGLSEEECGQFAPPSEGTVDAKTADAKPTSEPTDSSKPTAVKLGSNQFTELEQMSGSADRQSDLKYFHLFKNGACYEFALDVETSRKGDEELAQVDRSKIFKQLEKVLATTRIKEVELPGVENAEKTTTPESVAKEQPVVNGTQTEKAQVVTPEQK
ncbi:MAG: hypothetical protein ACRD3P_01755 [Terriglobales bacterium]